ncbi:MAG: recombinase family protein [Thermodesulfobacteriota bacterium]|jgi:DNA invertase Pin-like site-specific DNA recombinase
MKPERVALYARVSTLDKGQDVELQLSDLRTYADARGWKIFKEYLDIGQSGSKEQRPAFNQLMEDARKRKIDIVLVWRLDRFGRSLKHLIVSLDELKNLGLGFISFKESIDFTTATGRLMLHLLGAFAEFEKEIIRERVKAGVAHARAKGKRLGRRPLIDQKLLGTVRNMKNRGMSIRGISKELGVSKSLVHKSLQI